MLEKAGVSKGPRKKPSQTTDKKDIEVQTDPNLAYSPIILNEEKPEIDNSGTHPAIVSYQTEVHSELRSRVPPQTKTDSSDLIETNANVVGHTERSNVANSLPSPLPSGYKPSLPVIDNHSASTSQA